MSYGVLRVRTRDGRTAEHLLEQPSTVIGREEHSGIFIRDASISRRHARIIVEGGDVFIQDMGGASGTFVNGERLNTNERMTISPTDALKFGDVEAFYGLPGTETIAPTPAPAAMPPPISAPPPVSASPPLMQAAQFPSAPIPPPAPASSPQVAPSRVTVTILLANNRVDPGQSTQGTVTVLNRGNIVEQVTLSIAGLPIDWFTLAPSTFALLPGSKADATLTIRPPKQAEAIAGERMVTVIAALKVAGAEVSASATVEILPFEGTTVELTPRQSDGEFKVTVVNAGNQATHLQFSGDDAEAEFDYDFDPPFIEVPPGQTRTSSVRVKPGGRPMTGIRATKPFTLHVEPQGGAKKDLQGMLTIDPRFGKGLPIKKIAGVAILAVALLLGFVCFPRGEEADVPAAGATPDPSDPTAVAAASAAAVSAPDFLCGPEALPASPEPVAGIFRSVPVVLANFRTLAGADPSAPLFAQNDARWGGAEYAKATDDAFREQNACGKTIEQCGCAMTSVATVLSLFQIVTMPDGAALTPETVNNWFNVGATRTQSGWVSQGYIYGNVVWSAANQLSAAIKQKYPEARTIRFRSVGSGSEAQIRSELNAGRPVVLEVPGHWIAAIGIDKASNKILINDPYYADRTTLDVYAGKVKSSVLFEPADNLSAIVVSVPATARLKVTDGQGHVTGTLDGGPADQTPGKAQSDIAGSTYSFTAAWRDPTCTEKAPPAGAGTIQVVLPSGGNYSIEITSPTKGGTSVAVHAYDEKGNVTVQTKDSKGNQTIKITPTATAVASPSASASRTVSATAGSPTTAPSATIATPTPTKPVTVVPIVPTATTLPTRPPTVDPRPVASLDCGQPVISVRSFPTEATLNCKLAVTGKYNSIKWYYNHGRCDPPSGGGVCVGTSGPPAELEQWQNGLVINEFGAYTAEPVTYTFIANVCNNADCRAAYFWVEFKQQPLTN